MRQEGKGKSTGANASNACTREQLSELKLMKWWSLLLKLDLCRWSFDLSRLMGVWPNLCGHCVDAASWSCPCALKISSQCIKILSLAHRDLERHCLTSQGFSMQVLTAIAVFFSAASPHIWYWYHAKLDHWYVHEPGILTIWVDHAIFRRCKFVEVALICFLSRLWKPCWSTASVTASAYSRCLDQTDSSALCGWCRTWQRSLTLRDFDLTKIIRSLTTFART